jgi:hypothetical protein
MKPSGAVRILTPLAFAALAVVMTGCDDQFGPSDWSTEPDTVDLYSLSRAEYQGLHAGYDLVPSPVSGGGRHGRRVAVEVRGASGSWDFALIESEGGLELLPAGAFLGLANGAGIGLLPGADFESLDKVPGDRASYQDTAAVALGAGQVYALRSRTSSGCAFYGKLRPIDLDLAEGRLRFEVVRNINCNDRSMVPPKK